MFFVIIDIVGLIFRILSYACVISYFHPNFCSSFKKISIGLSNLHLLEHYLLLLTNTY